MIPSATLLRVPGFGGASYGDTMRPPPLTVDQFNQTQALGQGGRKEQPGIGQQAVIVEGDFDAVGVIAW